MKKTFSNICLIAGILLLLGALAWAVFNFYVADKAGEEADAATVTVMDAIRKTMEEKAQEDAALSGIPSESEASLQIPERETRTESGISTGAGIQTGNSAGSDAAPKPENVADSGTGTQTGNSTGSDAAPKSENAAGSGTGTQTGSSAGSDAAAKSENAAGNGTGTQTGSSAGSDAAAKSENAAGSGAGTQTGNRVSSDDAVKTGSGVGNDTDRQAGVNIDLSKGAVLGTQTETRDRNQNTAEPENETSDKDTRGSKTNSKGGSALSKEEREVQEKTSAPVREMTVKVIDRHEYIGILSIPALEIEIAVQSYWNPVVVEIAPCRYMGNLFADDLVICAHNYTKHFGKIHLLQPGDKVFFTDMDGVLHQYEVKVVETLDSLAVKEMTDSDYDLTLFTCTVGGQARVTVRCDRVVEGGIRVH